MIKKAIFGKILIIFMISVSSSVCAEAFGVSIIVNIKNPINDIDKVSLKRFFLKQKKHWPDGSSVKPIICAPNTPEGEIFLQKVINKTRHEMNIYWMLEKQTTGTAPTKIGPSNEFIFIYVSVSSGAIGYVASDFLKNKDLDKVKVIKVIK